MHTPTVIDNLRLPRWLLPTDWPQHDGVPVLARVAIDAGRVQSVQPAAQALAPSAATWDAAGTLALPGFVDAHTHLDKAFTLPRMKQVQPGLLGAIDAMLNDRVHWSPADVRERAARGLQWAWESGTTHLRTHVDWWEPDATPMAWPVMAELAQEWAGRVRLEQVQRGWPAWRCGVTVHLPTCRCSSAITWPARSPQGPSLPRWWNAARQAMAAASRCPCSRPWPRSYFRSTWRRPPSIRR